MNRLHAYFESIVRPQRTRNRIFTIVWLVACGAIAVWAVSKGLSDSEPARMAALSLLTVPVALFVLVWNLQPHRGLAALADPSRIVWHFGVMKGGQVIAVKVGFADGKLYRFDLPLISLKKGFSQEAFAHLRSAAPGATTTYSEETRQAFKKDPASLRR